MLHFFLKEKHLNGVNNAGNWSKFDFDPSFLFAEMRVVKHTVRLPLFEMS